MVNFKTLVLGASLKPERYAYRAVQMLQERNFEVIAMGRGEGFIGTVSMTKPFAKIPPSSYCNSLSWSRPSGGISRFYS